MTTWPCYAATSASASSTHPIVPLGYRPVPLTEGAPSDSVLAALNGHVYYSSAGYQIVAGPAVLVGVPAAALARTRAVFADDAHRISNGTAAMTPDGQVVAFARGGMSSDWLKRGRDVTICSHWWGYEVWFDAWASNHLVYGLAGGGVVGVLLKEIAGASWIVTAAIAAVGVFVNVCKHRNGTTDFVFVGPSAPFVSWYCH